jgi:hypothetical protein
MSHPRTIIRNTIVSLFKNNSVLKKAVEGRVYESKIYPIDTVPAIVVYTPNEQVINYTISSPRTQTRQLNVIIEIFAKANAAPDQTGDGLALEIEDILGSDLTLDGMVKDLSLHSSETILSGEGDKPIAVTSLTYHITYRTKENSASKLI